MAMLDNEHSTSQRVLGATVALEMKSADPEIVNALVKAMNEDPNTNVHLAALEHSVSSIKQGVKKALVEALSSQKDPMVQISLIRMLVDMNEKVPSRNWSTSLTTKK